MSKALIKNRNFIFLWTGHLISHAGDAVYAIALPWLMLEMTGSYRLTALVSMSSFLPALIFGLFAGVIVDHYNRKGIMIVSDIVRFFLVAIIPIAIIFEFSTPLLIGIITFLLSVCSTFFYPARDCFIPQITRLEELPIANSAIVISGQMSHLLGPLFAGIGISILGLTHLFTADAISFLVSILMISLIITPEKKKPIKTFALHIDSLKEGIRYIKKEAGLGTLLILTFANNIFIMGPAFLGLAVFVKKILKEEFVIFAYMETAMASGMIVGSIIFWLAIKYFKLLHILLIGMIIDGLTFSLLYFVQSNNVAILVLFFHGIGIPLIMVARTTLIQRIVPDKFRGRIFAIIHMAVMGTTAISIGLTGLTLDYLAIDALFLIIGICAALCTLIGFFSKNFLNLCQNTN